jgi:hypothetical protein
LETLENNTKKSLGNSKPDSQIGQSCKKEYSNTQILIHNIPLLSMFTLGALISGYVNLYLGIGYIIATIIGNYLFIILICAYCPHYGSKTALCGYGLITKYLAEHRRPSEFKSQFKKYIAVLFPPWFVPLIAGIIYLIYSFDWVVLILLIIFIILAFGVVLYVSFTQSCKTCKLKNSCPWRAICGN